VRWSFWFGSSLNVFVSWRSWRWINFLFNPNAAKVEYFDLGLRRFCDSLLNLFQAFRRTWCLFGGGSARYQDIQHCQFGNLRIGIQDYGIVIHARVFVSMKHDCLVADMRQGCHIDDDALSSRILGDYEPAMGNGIPRFLHFDAVSNFQAKESVRRSCVSVKLSICPSIAFCSSSERPPA
jgi:hypothetical protein